VRPSDLCGEQTVEMVTDERFELGETPAHLLHLSLVRVRLPCLRLRSTATPGPFERTPDYGPASRFGHARA
jgi:hypothetical protein